MARGWIGVALTIVAACGRLGFDEAGRADDAISDGADSSDITDSIPIDGPVTDGTSPSTDSGIDAQPVQTIACADVQLDSAVGASVAAGSINGEGNDYQSCSGDGNDITFAWFAPATGRYRFSLCNSEENWDSVLSVRSGACNGPSLGCDDDSCGGLLELQASVTVDLTAGEGVVIIVDSLFPNSGNYDLAITAL